MSQGHVEQQPLSDINTTPLIDVLLVLLIMFIITIPIQSHAVKLDLPSGPPPVVIDPIRNRIVLTENGVIRWNGAAMTEADLKRLLGAVGAMRDQPEIQIQPEARARYELVDEVLAMTKHARIKRLGFVGNEQYGRF